MPRTEVVAANSRYFFDATSNDSSLADQTQLLLVEGDVGPRLLSHDEWLCANIDVPAERPVQGDNQYYHERERGRESCSHRHVHCEVLITEKESIAGSDRGAEEYDPPH